jgi:hypothetical protein
VNSDAAELIRAGEGLATTAHLLTAMTRQQLDVQVRKGNLIRVWRGVYSVAEPDLLMRLRALDLLIGAHAVACLHTAATLYGFGIEESHSVHVHDPGVRLRPTSGLVVHQRQGAPIQLVSSRHATTPAWTAVELAREAGVMLIGRCKGKRFVALAGEDRIIFDADLRYVEEESAKHWRKNSAAAEASDGG